MIFVSSYGEMLPACLMSLVVEAIMGFCCTCPGRVCDRICEDERCFCFSLSLNSLYSCGWGSC